MSTDTRTDGDVRIVAPTLPGRLGDPALELGTDPRADPRLIEVLSQFDLASTPPPIGVTEESDLADILAFCAEAEPGYQALADATFASLDPVPGVERRTEVITGVDGNEVNLYIHLPAETDGPVPCVVHTHGGGMTILTAADSNYVYWRDSLASAGVAVVGVEFRNAAASLGPHPFPAGLNDCASGARWALENLASLGASHIIMSGESGGGNLAIATALLAQRDGWLDGIAGVYAQCPYVSGLYGNPPASLPSMFENDGYFLACSMLAALARPYDPDGSNAANPLAWPYHASAEQLAGLPPHVISVNELDPLRDEGLAYYRKLLGAGVSAIGRIVAGTCHAGDVLHPVAMPEVFAASVADVVAFAESVAPG